MRGGTQQICCRSVAAVAPAQFSFGWGYTLLVGARIQNKHRRDQGKKPEALFSIHRGSRYCAKAQLNKILFNAHTDLRRNSFHRLAHRLHAKEDGHRVSLFHRGSTPLQDLSGY